MEFGEIFPFAPEDGLLILALVNFIGSLIPFVPLPGFLLLATMSVGNEYNLHALALISAVSATFAKQISFYISFKGRRIMNEKTRTRMRPFERLVKRYGGGAAFIAAATPIPDDLVYIPLGLAKYSPKKFFVATLAGKILLSYIIVLVANNLGLSILDPILENIEDPTPVYIGIVVFSGALAAIVILMLRVDWRKVLGRVAPWTLEDDNDK